MIDSIQNNIPGLKTVQSCLSRQALRWQQGLGVLTLSRVSSTGLQAACVC